jgi:phosphoribosylamine--glycine ligase
VKVLVLGSGAREHALAWRLARDGADVLVGPGNGGTPRTVPADVADVPGLVALAQRERADLTIVGPEAPLALGVADAFTAAGLQVCGPTQAAARIEWSKAWAKDFLTRHGLPTARAEVVSSAAAARREIARRGLPIVLKADGLAAGKGVFVVHTNADLDDALAQLFTHQTLGTAAAKVLVEDYLDGPELTVLAFTDGERLAVMPPARDYKRLGDGDAGPNTGGMGGLARPTYAPPALVDEITARVLRPAVAGLAAEGTPFRGFLYAGLMLTEAGIRVIEFNSRFGDPECQLLLPLLETSLVETCAAIAAGALDPATVRWAPGQTYGVVLAVPGYPRDPRLGDPIDGLDRVPPAVQVFHAGTRRVGERLVTSGGRVVTLVSRDRDAVYAAARTVQFEGVHYRHDIGAQEARVPTGALA